MGLVKSVVNGVHVSYYVDWQRLRLSNETNIDHLSKVDCSRLGVTV